MKIGAIVPQGWVGEYDGWDPLTAWKRTTEVAQQADRLGRPRRPTGPNRSEVQSIDPNGTRGDTSVTRSPGGSRSPT
jgi:hypothetical protein